MATTLKREFEFECSALHQTFLSPRAGDAIHPVLREVGRSGDSETILYCTVYTYTVKSG